MVHHSGGVRLSVLERPSMLFHMLMKTEMKARLILVFCWVGFGFVWFWRLEIKCFGTAQHAVPHAEEDGNFEGAPNFGFLCGVGFGMVHRSGGVRLSVLERPSVLFHMLRKTEMKARLISALQRQ
jgi:hypothetical protein